MTGKEMADTLTSFVNSYGYDSKGFSERICRSHRTLQQSVMRLFRDMVHEMAQNDADDRNANAVALAKQIDEIAKDYPLPMI